jgi:hypothetical protein
VEKIDLVQNKWGENFKKIDPDKLQALNEILDEFRSVFTNN